MSERFPAGFGSDGGDSSNDVPRPPPAVAQLGPDWRRALERVCFGWNRPVHFLPSWSAKADHPRFVFDSSDLKTRGWSAFADHDSEETSVKMLPSETDRL